MYIFRYCITYLLVLICNTVHAWNNHELWHSPLQRHRLPSELSRRHRSLCLGDDTSHASPSRSCLCPDYCRGRDRYVSAWIIRQFVPYCKSSQTLAEIVVEDRKRQQLSDNITNMIVTQSSCTNIVQNLSITTSQWLCHDDSTINIVSYILLYNTRNKCNE